MIWIILCGVSLLGGCQRRAYTDLYVERMAGEIRELEDRIYEYDSAYRQTEDELDIIRSENESLRNRLAEQPSQYQKANNSTLRGRLEELRDSRNESSPKSSTKNLPSSPSIPGTDKSGSGNAAETTKRPPAIIPQPDPIADVLPLESEQKSVAPAKPMQSPTIPNKSLLETPPASPPSAPIDLEPPDIDLGVPSNRSPDAIMPLPLRPFPTTSIPLPKSVDPKTISSNQIVLPAFVTHANATTIADPRIGRSNTEPVAIATSIITATKARPQIGKPQLISQPADTRVVEIGFHPTLCRGGNREADPTEDGLRLVMQPKNQLSEFLQQPAGMTLVVVDPARPEGQSKIGRWTWTAEEMQASLEPIGVSQGFHLAVAWQSIRPTSKSVQVHVRYEMADGRRLVNQKEITLYSPSVGSDAWTPRVPK